MPKTILQTAGCGRVNGPLGKVRTDTMRKKNTTQHIPDQMLPWVLDSSLQKEYCLLGSYIHQSEYF